MAAVVTAAMVASIGAHLAWQSTLAVRQAENLAAARQGTALARAAAAGALGVVARDDPRFDHLGEPWARGAPPLDAGDARVTAAIADEQAKFNVNSLAEGSEAVRDAFRRLLARSGAPVSLADAVIDWIDGDGAVTEPAGAEDFHYLGLDAPYRAANRPIADIGELLLVKGFTEERYRKLAPFITALPAPTRVNVNTASPELLAALLPGLSTADARALAARRDKEPFTSPAQIAERLPQAAREAAGELLDVRTGFFTVEGTVSSGRIGAGFRALIGRDGPVLLAFSREFG